MRELGKSGIYAAPLALGGNVFGWTVDEATAFELLDAFIDGGFNLIDTSNGYSRWVPGNQGGESEAIIGNWIRHRPGVREKVVIATKVGSALGPGRSGLSRRHILEEIDASLRRLGCEYIDLYQAHQDDPNTPLEETLGVYDDLIKAGKVRAIGASNYTAARLQAALAVSALHRYPRYQTLQPRYNMHDRADFESELARLCQEQTIGVLPYFSLANGFLTGKYKSNDAFQSSRRGKWVSTFGLANIAEMFNARGMRILRALEGASEATGATAAQISLAWLLSHGVVAPIASATTRAQLSELMRGVRLSLPQELLGMLDKASAAEPDHTPSASMASPIPAKESPGNAA